VLRRLAVEADIVDCERSTLHAKQSSEKEFTEFWVK
jgi:hypothetical protein